MISHESLATGRDVSASLYVEIQQFYGRHMRAMDECRVEVWTSDFTEDAVFATNARPEPQIGRTVIAEGARKAAQLLTEQGDRRRHCVGTLEVSERPDGTVVAKSYAQLVRTPQEGETVLELFCTCEDVLIREEGRLFIKHRQVYRDDLPEN
ncbi:hypothetical protein Srufu_068810 [Streptomyces libani subsp. rufus]|nr:hypothetical protein Srufu_068810 [Streptomyces libani subsp. rufus]